MPSDEYVRIPEADLRRFDLALLQGLGLSADHAEILADNPFAFAIPAARERPIVLDMARSVSAYLRRERVDAARRGPNAARRDFGPPTGKWRKNRDSYSIGVVHLSLRPPASPPT